MVNDVSGEGFAVGVGGSYQMDEIKWKFKVTKKKENDKQKKNKRIAPP